MTVCVLSQSVVSNSLQPMTVALQAPLSWGFSRQEYWSGLPCPPPGDILNPGIEPRSSELQANSLPSEPGKHQIMASGPITSWQIEGEKVEVVTDFLFLGSKIIVGGDCSHEIRRLLLGRKAMTNLDSVLKSRDVTLPTKVCIVKAMVFPVVTYGCEGWSVKKAECQRIDAFELWCWRRLLKAPWTARSNQSIISEIDSGYSLEGLMPKLKLQSFGHLM